MWLMLLKYSKSNYYTWISISCCNESSLFFELTSNKITIASQIIQWTGMSNFWHSVQLPPATLLVHLCSWSHSINGHDKDLARLDHSEENLNTKHSVKKCTWGIIISYDKGFWYNWRKHPYKQKYILQCNEKYLWRFVPQ